LLPPSLPLFEPLLFDPLLFDPPLFDPSLPLFEPPLLLLLSLPWLPLSAGGAGGCEAGTSKQQQA
jgi:hypothetical protein